MKMFNWFSMFRKRAAGRRVSESEKEAPFYKFDPMRSRLCILSREAIKLGINPTEVRFELEEDLGRTPTLNEEYQEVLARIKMIVGPDWLVPEESLDEYYREKL